MGNNIPDLPDFSKMSEDETMRWLESLAARQGASAEEFVTSADMDVPDIDPNSVVIDEPGYVPSETFSFSKHAQPAFQQAAAEEEGMTEPMESFELEAQPDYQQWSPEQPVSAASTSTSQEDLAAAMAQLASSDPMAFLEALAARQGADPSQFVSGASVEVPQIDPNSVVIDEPGYVPSETFSFSQHAQPPAVSASLPEEATGEVPAYSMEPQADYQQWYGEQPAPEMPAVMEPQADYQQWYTEQPAATEPQADYQQWYGEQQAPEMPAAMEPQADYQQWYTEQPAATEPQADYQQWYGEQPPIETPAASSQEDLAAMMEQLASSDPMAFLEALAARQGADPSQFVSGASVEVPQIDPNSVVIDEPGYVPSETFSFSQHAQPPVVAGPPEQPGYEEPVYDPAAYGGYEQPTYGQAGYDFTAEMQSPVDMAGTAETPLADSELVPEADPMRWLESLALRHGVSPEELTTPADLSIPEIDPATADMSNVGPGYTPYSPYETVPGQSYQPPVETPQPPPPAYYEAATAPAQSEEAESLAWLQDLASDQGASASDFLGEFALEPGALPGFDLDFDASAEAGSASLTAMGEPSSAADSLAGVSDVEVAEMQAAGTITPEQELAWLMQKAQRMGEVLQASEAEDIAQEADAALLPPDLPDWLKQQMPDLSQLPQEAGQEQYPALINEIIPPPEPEGLPDWLSSDLGVDELHLELPAELPLVLEDVRPPEISEADVAALLSGYDQSKDSWVQAFKEEDEGTLGIELALDLEAPVMPIAEAEPEQPAMPSIPELLHTATTPVAEAEGPGWLFEAVGEGEAAPAGGVDDSDLPEWLRMSVTDTGSIGIEDWLREQETGVSEDTAWIPSEPALEEAAIGDWLATLPIETIAPVDMLAGLDEITTPITPITPTEYAASPQPFESRAAQLEGTLERGIDGNLPPWYAGGKPLVKPVEVVSPEPRAAPAAPAYTTLPRREPAGLGPTPPPAPPASLPEGQQFATYRSTLEKNPQDYDTRLKLARELHTHGSLSASLEQYETLIENSTMLDLVATDLSALANRAQHPKVRRLLGDVYMRQGRLQEALDTYRGALNQL